MSKSGPNPRDDLELVQIGGLPRAAISKDGEGLLTVKSSGSVKASLTSYSPIHDTRSSSTTKQHTNIVVVGCGNVGTSAGRDVGPMDLQHAIAFLRRTRIRASSNYSITADSNTCIITVAADSNTFIMTAGTRQNPEESRLNLLQSNLTTFKMMVSSLVEHSPEMLLVVVSDPVDVMTNILMWYRCNLRKKYKYIHLYGSININGYLLHLLLLQDKS
ncbi:L-lactate dehydrogenase A [Canna indica]|uniref:L-lactate dehydrogenase A n=1 Tax=Canna indica TaxID=4628 RepID=A0AAQ3KAM0_9LILI|nr:L-lactate dehydrogenase A [Canna indica]